MTRRTTVRTLPARIRPVVASVGLAGVALLAGCSGGSSQASPASEATTATVASDGSTTCATKDLDVGSRVPAGSGSSGSTAILLTFTDTGSSPCRMAGFPGVSFVGGPDRTPLGTPAERVGSARSVTLLPGVDTTAVLQVADAGSYPSDRCDPATSAGLRVYAPGSTRAAFVAYAVDACRGSTGSSPQLAVQSVGTTVP